MSEQTQRLHTFDLATFKSSQSTMIAKNDAAYGQRPGATKYGDKLRNYTIEQVEKIIESGSLKEQQTLSRTYFQKDGYYK